MGSLDRGASMLIDGRFSQPREVEPRILPRADRPRLAVSHTEDALGPCELNYYGVGRHFHFLDGFYLLNLRGAVVVVTDRSHQDTQQQRCQHDQADKHSSPHRLDQGAVIRSVFNHVAHRVIRSVLPTPLEQRQR